MARALAAGGLPAPVWLLAAGKGAVGMASAAADALGSDIRGGLVVGPKTSEAPAAEVEPAELAWASRIEEGVRFVEGGHPVPNARSEEAGRAALALAASVPPAGTLLALLSGGASSMITVPAPGLSLADKQGATSVLLRGGADIRSLNAVRKHLSAIKGGWLAAATRARCRTLAISDVVGDDLSVIGSGPTVADATSFADGLDVVRRFGGERAYPRAVVNRLTLGATGALPETPKPGDERLSKSFATVIGGRHDAMAGAEAEARRRGYRTIVFEEAVVGEARHAAVAHLAAVSADPRSRERPLCVVSSGETTVHVRGGGSGGRNQEFALAAADGLAGLGLAALASIGTDGVDGPTDAAGAIADSSTMARARQRGLSARQHLDDNDSYRFFSPLDDLVRTGPTGTNVGDLQILLLG